MKRLVFAATVAATLVPAAPSAAQVSEQWPESYTSQQAMASPTVTVGDRTARRLCEIGLGTTAPWAGQGQPGISLPRLPCSQQSDVYPLKLNRARYARVALQAPADRLLAGWYRDGALRPLRPVQTGAQQWNVTLPATSGRLVLSVIFHIDSGPPYEARVDWKLAIRRAPRPQPTPTEPPVATEPPLAEPVIPIDSTPEEPAPTPFTGSGR